MEFALIATAHFLALLSPGPDFFLIMQASIRLPIRYCIAICAGIAFANAVYLICAVAGIEAIRQMQWLMSMLQYLGALYLVFIGIMLIKAPRQQLHEKQPRNFLQTESVLHQFVLGFLSGILNPKNAIFYLSLFTVLVSEQTGLTSRCMYALWMTSVVFFWDCTVALALANTSIKKFMDRTIFYIEKVSGVMLAIFGILLPFT